MITTRLYLDIRKNPFKGSLKVMLNAHHKQAAIPLGIYLAPEQWNAEAGCVTKNHPQQKAMNMLIQQKVSQIEGILMQLAIAGNVGDITETKNTVIRIMSGKPADSAGINFLAKYRHFYSSKKAGTIGIYKNSERRLYEYDPFIEQRTFDQIDVDYLNGLNKYLSRTESANTRSITFRNIRAVFNDALAEGCISCYPFKRFKIPHQQTAKRSLSVEELRQYFNAPVTDGERFYLDMFKLMFYFMGINAVDLFQLTDIDNKGRINYNREKTGRLYSIKVEPEAMAIIERYKGKDGFLLNLRERYSSHLVFVSNINKNLKRIGATEYVPTPTATGLKMKKVTHPLQPQLSTYWSRHSWATCAAGLDIPKETIAQALGHSAGTVTDIYIRFDQKKVDEANRKVIDLINKAH